ncbi:hypothetical protein [Baekduia sp. Peel2402]|uniref:hypothetical protein n=1 Tax=Baekduia sp. Peel2402 TaxID=3458296 RepID=UPI00403E56DD
MSVPRQCIGSGVTRGALLRGGAAAALGAAIAPGAARAALPAPQPQGDDVGSLQFALLAEQVSAAYYTAAGDKTTAKRKAQHVAKLIAGLGADAPAADDFAVRLPAKVTPALGVRIETLLVRSYTTALASTTDGSTRLLLARLLAVDSQLLTVARAAAKLPPVTGLPVPIDLEQAGEELDALLSVPNYPTT